MTPFLTVAQAAKILNVSTSSVRRMIDEGQIDYLRVGPRKSTIRIPPEALEAYQKAQTINKKAE